MSVSLLRELFSINKQKEEEGEEGGRKRERDRCGIGFHGPGVALLEYVETKFIFTCLLPFYRKDKVIDWFEYRIVLERQEE